MKRILLVLVTLAVAALPFTSYSRPMPHPGPVPHPAPVPHPGPMPHPGPVPHPVPHPGPHHGGGDVAVSCAPSVVTDNLVALDQNLTDLGQTAEFANTEAFRVEVDRIGQMVTNEERVNAYFALVGINSADNDQVASFLGARDVDQKWVNSLKAKTQLNDAQASRVVDVVSKSLVGELQ